MAAYEKFPGIHCEFRYLGNFAQIQFKQSQLNNSWDAVWNINKTQCDNLAQSPACKHSILPQMKESRIISVTGRVQQPRCLSLLSSHLQYIVLLKKAKYIKLALPKTEMSFLWIQKNLYLHPLRKRWVSIRIGKKDWNAANAGFCKPLTTYTNEQWW